MIFLSTCMEFFHRYISGESTGLSKSLLVIDGSSGLRWTVFSWALREHAYDFSKVLTDRLLVSPPDSPLKGSIRHVELLSVSTTRLPAIQSFCDSFRVYWTTLNYHYYQVGLEFSSQTWVGDEQFSISLGFA